MGELAQCAVELGGRLAIRTRLGRRGALRIRRPGASELVGVLSDPLPTRVGQCVLVRAGVGRDVGDKTLVDELLEGRVDRAGTRAPGPFAALVDLGDDAVAGGGSVGEDAEDRDADVAATRAASAAAAEGRAEEVRAETGACLLYTSPSPRD